MSWGSLFCIICLNLWLYHKLRNLRKDIWSPCRSEILKAPSQNSLSRGCVVVRCHRQHGKPCSSIMVAAQI